LSEGKPKPTNTVLGKAIVQTKPEEPMDRDKDLANIISSKFIIQLKQVRRNDEESERQKIVLMKKRNNQNIQKSNLKEYVNRLREYVNAARSGKIADMYDPDAFQFSLSDGQEFCVSGDVQETGFNVAYSNNVLSSIYWNLDLLSQLESVVASIEEEMNWTGGLNDDDRRV